MNTVTAKKEFRRHQRVVKQAIDAAKEWICGVSDDAEKAKKDGRERWMYVRKLQMAYQGHRTRRP